MNGNEWTAMALMPHFAHIGSKSSLCFIEALLRSLFSNFFN
jgi:hypothetical protein